LTHDCASATATATGRAVQHPNILLQHPDKKFCNIRLKYTKYLEHAAETPLQHVQHTDLLLKHLDATLATYKKKTDETLETCV
jgi:hypothetical protein